MQVWDRAVPPKEDRMNREQFESALKLVALLQVTTVEPVSVYRG